MRVQVHQNGRWEWFVSLGNAEDGTVLVKGTTNRSQSFEFMKREDADSIVGHLTQELPDLRTRIV